MGTIQDPGSDRDREWLKRSYVETDANPFSIASQTDMMGGIVEGTGTSRMARIGRRVFRISALIILGSIALGGLVGILREAL
ncbi:hypothetical protein AB0F72_04235 [Actinoplanes sp. NPDC023936]|uniref:hypothetical protein n=1 Tax=Actinoplanes sp. NPDC023936 TaxID=3154910 RepID=UPI0033E7D704